MKEAKGIFLMLGGVIAFLLVAGFIAKNPGGVNQILSRSTPVPVALVNLKPVTIGRTTVMVEVADTDALRSKGLSGITSLPIDQGMFFDFGSKNISAENARFWMKDMLIPLDFLWITNNQVVEITPNVPAPAANTPDNQLIIYQPDQPIDYVIEVNAGFALNNNIKVGDTFSR